MPAQSGVAQGTHYLPRRLHPPRSMGSRQDTHPSHIIPTCQPKAASRPPSLTRPFLALLLPPLDHAPIPGVHLIGIKFP